MEKELLRKVQLAQLEIAKEFKRICDENDIKYFMDSGTLLGAVRHKGFIPWDDDMDFGMLRDEYERFIKIAPQKLGKDFFLQSWDIDENYPFAYAKIRKKNTVFLEAAFQKSLAHNELYVDIFPYDVYPKNKGEQRKQGRNIKLLKNSMLMHAKVAPWLRHSSVIERVLVRIKYLPYIMYACFNDREKIKEKYNKIMRLYNEANSRFVYEQTGGTPYGKWVLPSKCFKDYQMLRFEDTEFMAPIDASLYLETIYGDYMKLPPEEKRGDWHKIIEVKL